MDAYWLVFVSIDDVNSTQLIPLPNKRIKSASLELYSDDSLPCTDIAFIPKRSEIRRLISACRFPRFWLHSFRDASGFIRIWQFTSNGKVSLWKSWRETEVTRDGQGMTQYNQILCLAVSADSKRFVTGGSDTVIRAYDLHSTKAGKPLIPSIRTDATVARNYHTNRVTSLVYHPRGAKDPVFAHIFFSASWDGTVQGWDDRNCGSLWQHSGTSVSGSDGLCVDSLRNLLISGSYKHDTVLSQVWEAWVTGDSDSRSSGPSTDRPLSIISQEAGLPCVQVYVARITPDNQVLVFGGTNCNMIKLMQLATMRQLVLVTNLTTGVYSADTCMDPADKRRILVAFTNGSKVYLLLVDPRNPTLSDMPQ